MLHITPSHRWEAEWLATRLREGDRREVFASTGRPPEEVLPLAFDIAAECYTIRGSNSDDPIGIFGVGNSGLHKGTGRVGIPWMLCTDALVNDHGVALLRVSRQWVRCLGRNYDALANYVYAENDVHVRWLQWCGFALRKLPVKYGPFDQPFYPFAMRIEKDV
jgi:hypothetical protein